MAVAGVRREDNRSAPRLTSLDEQVSYLAALFVQSPVGLAVFDTSLRYVAVNPALSQINGLAVDAHLGRRVPEVLPDLQGDVEGLMRRVLASGEPLVGVLTRGRTPADGSREHVWEVSYYRLGERRGEPLGISLLVTDVTRREDAQKAVAAAHFRLALVNEASARIGTTLDLRRTCTELAEVAVPRFADLVTVDLLEPVLDVDGPAHGLLPGGVPLRRIALRAATAAIEDSLPDRVGSRIVHPPTQPAVLALADGRAALVGQPIQPESDRALLPGSPPSPYDQRLPVVSAILAPLVARGRVLGVVAFHRVGSSSAFDDQDLALAEELTARSALAIDNALLYRRERVTAVALQRALLPQGRPRLAGLDVASRYQPGSLSTEVGGDWFDVIPLSAGRVALVVGDVMGRGLRAAAAMGQLRTAVRTLAVLDLLSDDVVAHLDHVTQSLEGVQLATCVYAVYDPVLRTLTYASAGHLPLALLPPRGPAALLPTPSGAPLGVGGVPFECAEIAVPDGSVLVLYTDGLVESRTDDLDTGLATLTRVLDESAPEAADAGAPLHLETLCDRVLRGLGRDGAHDDDVALLAARMTGLPETCTASWSVRPDLSAVADSRHATAEHLDRWDLAALEDVATLLVSEVVTNAVRYARDPILVRLLILGDVLVCAVQDSDARLPRLRRAGADDEGGRGLHLVGMLARRWGARPTTGGKVVWFELGLPAG